MQLTIWISLVTGIFGAMMAFAALSLEIEIPTLLKSVLEMVWPLSLLSFLTAILFALFPIKKLRLNISHIIRKE